MIFEFIRHGAIIIENIGIALMAFCAMLIADNIMLPLGGIAYVLLSIPQRLPYIGIFYRRLTHWPLRLSFLFKIIGFALSSSGCIIPLYIIQSWHRQWLASPWVLWGILLGALSITMHIMHRAHLMQISSIDEIFELPGLATTMNKLAGFEISEVRGRDKMQLARTHFADIMVVDFLRILICFSVIQFVGNALGVISVNPLVLDTPQKGIDSVFAFTRIITGTAFHLDGPIGPLAAAFYGISLFFFMSFFVSLTSRMVDEPPTPRLDPDEFRSDIEVMVAEIIRKTDTEFRSDSSPS